MKLIIPDKYRGTLTAAEAARAIAEGLGGECLCLPMADGGEGTAASLPGCSVIESSSVIGHGSGQAKLPLLHRSSYPLGTAIAHALSRDDSKICVAVGGTATADGGAGLLQALGVRFYDSAHKIIEQPLTPHIIADIAGADLSSADLHTLRQRLVILSDVEAGLTSGPLTALDFLQQKGADVADFPVITHSLQHLHELFGGSSPFDGAGGGIGYALAAVLGCRAALGAEYILGHLPVDWSKVELVATGEGSIDRQSLAGKVVGTVLEYCRQRNIPAVAFGGRISSDVTDERCIEVTPKDLPLPTPEAAYRLTVAAARSWAEKNQKKIST